jgi:hypothetical protein
MHENGGKSLKLTLEDKLYITLKYLREYRTMLKRKPGSIQYIVVYVTKSPVNRPKEGQKEYYSRKKAPYAENTGNH